MDSAQDNDNSSDTPQGGLSRRTFLGTVGALTATGAASAIGLTTLAAPEQAHAETQQQRMTNCYLLRQQAALRDRVVGEPPHSANGDELRYANRIASYSKGLRHNSLGEVDPAAYDSLLRALDSGNPQDFENIVMGGNMLLVNPQAGLAYDMEGLDSHQFAIPPAPPFASPQRAAEAVELYWMALLRDVNFTQYGSDPGAAAAAAELSRLRGYQGPGANGAVTGGTLFRGFTAGDATGPYVSQFLLRPLAYGAIPLEHKINTYLPLHAGGQDYLTDAASWLAVQNGINPGISNRVDPAPRHIRNGRDLAAYVHVDVLFEAYLNACIWLVDNNAPLNPGNPYVNSRTQTGFGTFGAPYFKALLAEVATRALKAVWYQKWFVHRVLRPEEFGGRVHFTQTGAASYPISSDVLNSQALAATVARNGTYFLPHAFPEGCPLHPSYGQGHGTVAGACATMVKAFFDDSWVVPNPVVASEDGLSLEPYTGSDAAQITLGGEMNKLAANIALGRCHAAVHWRSDYAASLPLGEQVAISVLRDQAQTYNEDFHGLTFTKFDGTTITV